MSSTIGNVLCVKDLQKIFHIGKNAAYSMMKSDGFPSIRINKRLFVYEPELVAWIERNRGKEYLI